MDGRKTKIGILGGTFNPVHYGHLRAADEVRERLNLDKILFIPSGNPPLKNRELADYRHRYEMVRVAISGNRFFEISDIEGNQDRKSYTVETIEKLRQTYPAAAFFFIAGIDAFNDLPKWKSPERLTTLTNFVVISRPAFCFTDLAAIPYLRTDKKSLGKLDNMETYSGSAQFSSGNSIIFLRITSLDISATGIRKLVKRCSSIRYLLPEPVESYIISKKLYIK